MRAYLAILKDSYREARASRVLWISLVGIAIVLLLLAPINLSKETAVSLRRVELAFPDRMLEKVSLEKDQQGTPSAHLWSLLSADQQKRVTELMEGKGGRSRRGPGGGPHGEIVQTLNNLLKNEKFYDEDVWSGLELNDEAAGLVADGSLEGSTAQRRNLLLLAAAFPEGIRLVDDTSLGLYYANAEIIGELPFPPAQIERVIEIGVTAVLGFFLGIIGVFCSLLVTSGVIPRTFEPGEIALLLSKPINRSGLFLVKFLGGCTFTLLYASVLVTGVWLLLGVRLDYWQINLLWCIPVYVFLFAIYYAVSAVAGAVWRNPIVALVSVVIFYIGLKTVEITQLQMKREMIEARAIREVVAAGEDIMAIDGDQKAYVWNAEEQKWDERLKKTASGMAALMRGSLAANYRFLPVYDAASERVLALQPSAGRFARVGPPTLVAGYRESDWERESLGRLPEMVKAIHLDSSGRILLPAAKAIYEFVGQTDKEQKRADFLNNVTGGFFGGGRAFRKVPVEDLPDFGDEFTSAIHPATDDLYLLGDGQLCRLKALDDGGYQVAATVEFDTQERSVMAAGGAVCLVAQRGGRVVVCNAESLQVISDTEKLIDSSPRVLTSSPDGGSVALLTHGQQLLLWDAATGEQRDWSPSADQKVNAVSFSEQGRLLTSDGRLAAIEYDVAARSQTQRWAERPSWAYGFYDNFVYPAWSLLPKPAELTGFIPYVMGGEPFPEDGPPIATEGDTGSLEQDDDEFDAIGVIRSNGLFIGVLLLFGCLYVSRKDY